MENSVFSREELDGVEISPRLYNLVIGAVLFWGFFINGQMVSHISPQTILAVNPWVFYIGYFASCFFGIYLFTGSQNPLISLLGYHFVVVPFGLVINLVVAQYDPTLVLQAIKITGVVTAIMMCLGALFPAFFARIHSALTISLLIVILVQLYQIFVLRQVSAWIDWVVVLIFCGYIGYDWGRANQIPKTLDNAVDSAAALYMDIINLFLRILRILGRRQ